VGENDGFDVGHARMIGWRYANPNSGPSARGGQSVGRDALGSASSR
jgi:hypothetical protein